ncbi:MAG: hypothetical protein LBR33_09605, partial [Propionibacteriaceae bacterium]|nr:hypothetical protein [Propionibacteriaceae bacterium]
ESGLVGASFAFSALVGLVALLLAARTLSVADASRFTLFWALLFALFGVLTGLSLETTRTLTAAATPAPATAPTPAAPWPAGRIIAVAAAAVAGLGLLTLPAWRLAIPAAAGGLQWAIGGAVLLGAMGYAGHTTCLGTLAGAQRWRLYSLVTFAESALRLVLLSLAAAARLGLIGFAYATAAAEFAWLLVLAAPSARAALRRLTDAGPLTFWRRALSAMGGQGANALLGVGFPFLLGLTTGANILLTAAPLNLAISLTRAPLMVPLTAFQSVAVAYFTRRREGRRRTLATLLGLVAGIGLVGAALAWAIGPWLMGLIGDGYAVAGPVLAGLTLGAAAITGLTLTGVLCQAVTRYKAYLTGWLAALAVAIVALLTPASLETRAIAALTTGPLVGIALHLLNLRRPDATRGRGPEPTSNQVA